MVCIDFKMLEVKVPIIFSGTQGFPARRDRRYWSLRLNSDHFLNQTIKRYD